MSAESMARDYIRARHGIPVKRGLRVVFNGRPGKITGFRHQYLLVRLDGETAPVLLHPTWRVAYPGLGIEATA